MVRFGKRWICSKCYYKLKPEISFKKTQINKNLYVNYIFIYKDILRERILDFKFNDCSYLYRFFSELIIRDKKICNFLNKSDFIIPVPMHINNKKKRGYNQTELISKELAKSLNLIYDKSILVKKMNNKTQSSLNEYERRKNVKNVYKINNPEKIKDKKVILFDDICTTGSTIKECYKLLKRYTNEITVLVLAKSNYKKG